MNKVYLSLGSNQGKSYENIIQSIKLIEQVKEINLVNKSKIYITKPMYNQNQNYFLNMVVEIRTSLNPFLLLRKLKKIERKLGKRINEKKNQPRKKRWSGKKISDSEKHLLTLIKFIITQYNFR